MSFDKFKIESFDALAWLATGGSMFIGHFAVALGAKRYPPRASLAWLTSGVVWADILWTLFLMLGWEHTRIVPGITAYSPLDLYDFPWSHSLLMLVVWGLALGGVYWLLQKDKAGAWAIGLCVLSHWILDWATHRPDMPLYPGGPKFGAGLWNSIPGTLVVETVMLLLGAWLYAKATAAKNAIGKYALWTYVVVLLVLFYGDRYSAPPESASEIAWVGSIATVILLGWTWWIDRNREVRIS